MTFSIGVRTVRREGADYLSTFLSRLAEIGATSHRDVLGVHICDGTGLDITANENGCRAIETALCDRPDWVMFLEDDVDPINDLIGSVQRWMEDHERPGVHLYPLACQYSQCFKPGATAWEYRTGAYYGSQALLLRASAAPSAINYVRTEWAPHRGFDLALARWHESYAPETTHLVTPVPCFVDHIGSVSTLGCNVGRFAGFPGRDFSYQRAEVNVG